MVVCQFVVNIQISNLLAVSKLRQIAVDPVDDRSERQFVVPGKDSHHDDCRGGRLLLNHMQNRLKSSRDVGSSFINATWSLQIADVVCASQQNDDFGVDSVQLSVL